MSQTVAIIKSDCCERVYCAFGSRRAGFGVRIIWKYPQKKTEIAETPCIFPTREKALRWMKQLADAGIHPLHLLDVTRDHFYQEFQ